MVDATHLSLAVGDLVTCEGLDAASNNGSTEAPAIVVRVWGYDPASHKTTANVRVFLDGSDVRWLTSVYVFDTKTDRAAYHTDHPPVGPSPMPWCIR